MVSEMLNLLISNKGVSYGLVLRIVSRRRWMSKKNKYVGLLVLHLLLALSVWLLVQQNRISIIFRQKIIANKPAVCIRNGQNAAAGHLKKLINRVALPEPNFVFYEVNLKLNLKIRWLGNRVIFVIARSYNFLSVYILLQSWPKYFANLLYFLGSLSHYK